MPKIVFSSAALPAHLGDRARFSLWRDLFISQFGACDMAYAGNKPFTAHWSLEQFGAVAISQFATTIDRYARTSQHVATDTRGDFLIGFDRSQASPTLHQRGRQLALTPGQLALFSNAEPAESRAGNDMALVGLMLPRQLLLERIAHADDLALAQLDVSGPVARHLRRYLEFLLEPDTNAGDPALAKHVETTILDLVALALGAGGEVAEIARLRGLRAARLREILQEINRGFADAAFTVHGVALKLGLSPRYAQDLLHETGTSFTERVTELRLQKARVMLADPRHDRLKVSDIAYACGFNDISYFNRCFRRRFGASPREYRRGGGGAR